MERSEIRDGTLQGDDPEFRSAPSGLRWLVQLKPP
jgi:hypothetical protein